jgi:hypothetical protein
MKRPLLCGTALVVSNRSLANVARQLLAGSPSLAVRTINSLARAARLLVWGRVAAAGLGLLLSRCVDVDGELARVTVTREALTFQGVPRGTTGVASNVSQSIVQSPSDVPDVVELDLRPMLLTLTLQSGADDLSFLTDLEIYLSCASDSNLPMLLLFEFHGQVPPLQRYLTMMPERQPNLVDYWECGGARYELAAIGALPPGNWTVTVEFELRGDFDVSL